MAKRIVLRIEPAEVGWTLRGNHPYSFRRFFAYRRQIDAIKQGRWMGNAWLRVRGRLAQLVCHGRSGMILWEATYGRDPRRYKG